MRSMPKRSPRTLLGMQPSGKRGRDAIFRAGQIEFTTAGSYDWIVPDGVYSVCAVAVGAGGSYMGAGGQTIIDFGNTYVGATGGGRGGGATGAGGSPLEGAVAGVRGGGSGGVSINGYESGGGGAGGYSGSGGNGSVGRTDGSLPAPGGNGTGGAGGGGSGSTGSYGAPGGGVGLRGEGDNGLGGYRTSEENAVGRTGSVHPGIPAQSIVDGGVYGGGGGGQGGSAGGAGGGLQWKNDIAVTPGQIVKITVGLGGPGSTPTSEIYGAGGTGGVRIIWGANRSYPSNNTQDV